MDSIPPSPRRHRAVIQRSRLAAYAAAGTAATFTGAQSTEASISYFQVGAVVRDTSLGGTMASRDLLFDGFHLSLVHTLGSENAANGVALAFPDPNSIGFPVVQFAGFRNGNFSYVANIPAGSAISSLGFPLAAGAYATMAFNSGYAGDRFTSPGIAFIGVKFDTDRYGWIRVNMSGAPLNSFTIVDYAYAGHGESIYAGQTVQIPEPGALGLLALGATGLANWRRRKVKG